MKKFVTYILLLLPSLVFGQLFPKVPDFRGNIERVTEKRFGKEVDVSKRDSGVFRPGKFSGWKYTYLFDEHSELAERTNSFQGKVNAAYLYRREKKGTKFIERELVKDTIQGIGGDYIEYENITDSIGRVKNVNFWSFNSERNFRELFLVEMYPEYENGNLTSFTRYNIKENGDILSREKCNLFYDASGRLIRTERKYIELNLKTVIYYSYNSRGLIDHCTISYLVGLRNDQNKQNQDIFYKYDSRGNWVKRFYLIDGKRKLEARRSIKYY